MKIEWQITARDKARVQEIVGSQQHRGLMRYRKKHNLASKKEEVTKDRLWRAIVCMRLTTQARSTPQGTLASFQKQVPFPLSYDKMRDHGLDQGRVHSILKEHKVGRHQNIISQQLTENFHRLEAGEWHGALDQCNLLRRLQPRDVESSVADHLENILLGIGPKQARNILQALCLTRYEIPIDSRVTNWLNKRLSFPFKISSAALSDRDVYRLIMDGVCALCAACNIYPCLLDAAIFGAMDKDEWSDEIQRY